MKPWIVVSLLTLVLHPEVSRLPETVGIVQEVYASGDSAAEVTRVQSSLEDIFVDLVRKSK